MRKSIFKTFNETIKHWYIPAIVGSIFIAVGIYTFASPATSYVALSILFSLCFYSGLRIASPWPINEMDNWGWMFTFGVLTTVVGGLLLANPEVSMLTLSFYVGFLIIFRAISAISFFRLKDYGVVYRGALMHGIIGLIFGVLMVWSLLCWHNHHRLDRLGLYHYQNFSLYLSFKLKNSMSFRKNAWRFKIWLLQQEINEVNKALYRQGKTYDHEPKPKHAKSRNNPNTLNKETDRCQ